MARFVPSRRLTPALALLPIFAALPLAAQTTPTPPPSPSPRPLPTRRPTPSPGITPIPVRSTANQLMLEGFVSGRPRRNEFFLRASGMVYRVQPYDVDLLRQIAGGDAVRVFGHADGLVITNANVRTLRNRASNSPDDYSPGNATDNR